MIIPGTNRGPDGNDFYGILLIYYSLDPGSFLIRDL